MNRKSFISKLRITKSNTIVIISIMLIIPITFLIGDCYGVMKKSKDESRRKKNLTKQSLKFEDLEYKKNCKQWIVSGCVLNESNTAIGILIVHIICKDSKQNNIIKKINVTNVEKDIKKTKLDADIGNKYDVIKAKARYKFQIKFKTKRKLYQCGGITISNIIPATNILS